jgi:hypothetical protein
MNLRKLIWKKQRKMVRMGNPVIPPRKEQQPELLLVVVNLNKGT